MVDGPGTGTGGWRPRCTGPRLTAGSAVIQWICRCQLRIRCHEPSIMLCHWQLVVRCWIRRMCIWRIAGATPSAAVSSSCGVARTSGSG